MDDERSVQLLLDRVLTGAGHTVSIVDTGEAALTELNERPYDLVIADKNLPGLDGLEVLRQARTRNPNLRAVVITGFPTPESKQQAKTLGIHAFVTKPFGILDFLEICDAALERSTAS
jgi:CheY-like chemotaxis protein